MHAPAERRPRPVGLEWRTRFGIESRGTVPKDRPRLVECSPLEVMLNGIDFGMQPQEAVDAPRIHHQWFPDNLTVEPFALSPDTQDRLEETGYRIVTGPPWGEPE